MTDDGDTRAEHPFAFTGNARDYFRIWIVNLLLTLATLGIWSAWAKVRKRRYFYGHTWVAGANFEYHGDPIAILRGRVIAAGALLTYWAVEHLRPGAGPWLLLALMLGLPWIVARSLAFNATNSSHRGIRFQFRCDAIDVAMAIWPIYLWPIALIVVDFATGRLAIGSDWRRDAASAGAFALIGVLYPLIVARIRRLAVAQAKWGRCRFHSTLRTRTVYRIYIVGALLGGVLGGVLIGGLSGAAIAIAAGAGADYRGIGPYVIFIITGVAYAVVVTLVVAYTRSRMTNLTFETARLAPVGGFRSMLAMRRLARLYFVNLIAIVVTAGLMIPWAVIRVARYRAESLTLLADGPVDAVIAADSARIAATGEEMAEAFGFDLAV